MNRNRSAGGRSRIVVLTSIFWALCEIIVAEEPAEYTALDIFDIAADCRHDYGLPYNIVNQDCFDRLTKYFDHKPIWKMANMYYYIAAVNVRSSSQSINHRADYLKFSDSNFLQDAPTWGDIFDGKEGERQRIVEHVFADNACRDLAESGAIRPKLAERCRARDLFKYASHLDSCITGFKRSMLLLSEIHKGEGKMVYEENIEEIRRRSAPDYEWEIQALAPVSEITELGIIEFAMHSSWVVTQCASLPGTTFDDELRPVAVARGTVSVFDIDEYAAIVEKGSDAALGIAARAGDPWAIQSYYPPHPTKDPAYWTALRETNPLLVHRWMASAVGGTMLSAEERLWHAVKAYAIERERFADLDLEEYVGEYLIHGASLDQLLADEAGPAPDDAKALAGKAVARVADGERLKYPWVSPPRQTP